MALAACGYYGTVQCIHKVAARVVEQTGACELLCALLCSSLEYRVFKRVSELLLRAALVATAPPLGE